MTYQRVEILTGTERRRSYPPGEKLRMVEAAFRPGVVVAEAARRLGVHESLLYRWRLDLARECALSSEPPSGFAAVEITAEPLTTAPAPPPSEAGDSSPTATGIMEIALAGGVRVRFIGGVDPALAAAALSALVAPGRAS